MSDKPQADSVLTPRQAAALEALQKSAESGDAQAQYRLGLLYGNGEGVALDHAQAEHWFTEAARQGHEDALLNLAWLYATGTGVEMDEPRARELYLLAADKGSGKAAYVVATMYRFGQHGSERDMARALRYYQLAADKGVASAQFALGKLLMEGKQVPRDDVTALAWLTLAQAGGSRRAEQYIPHLVQRMSPEQLARAREMLTRGGA
jgi:TPR repeat protein